MARLVRFLVLALVLGVTGVLAMPWLQTGWYALRLVRMPAPASLAMPVQNVKPGALADTWHAARAPARRHEGIDIFAKRGTPVLAATEGVVLRGGTSRLGGNVVWVLGPAGHQHYYAHLDRPATVAPGQRVAAGTPLGIVGDTGNAKGTPPHLHYGVYTDDGPVNPYPLLKQHQRASSARTTPSAPSS